MKSILFIHQGFPGQFGRLASWLAQNELAHVRCIGLNAHSPELGYEFSRYSIDRQGCLETHPLAQEFETKVIRAASCARHLWLLKNKGYQPDLVYAHPGWGECLLVKEIWPSTRLVTYQEFFYRTSDSDLDFDPEWLDSFSIEVRMRARLKNAHLLLSLQDSDACISPTDFQRSVLPSEYHKKVTVIHDGIDPRIMHPDPSCKQRFLELRSGLSISPDRPLITFVNRSLEPYRGIHTFIRSIPLIQAQHPDAEIVIVGAEKGVSYGSPCDRGMEWKEYFLKEIEGLFNPLSVHFVGQIPHADLMCLFQRSDCHVYLTYPFVLSWSLLEAMSCQAPIVASAVAPVQEIITDRQNGLLVDFFSQGDLSAAISKVLNDRSLAIALGRAARQKICEKYDVAKCLQQQWEHLCAVIDGKA